MRMICDPSVVKYAETENAVEIRDVERPKIKQDEVMLEIQALHGPQREVQSTVLQKIESEACGQGEILPAVPLRVPRALPRGGNALRPLKGDRGGVVELVVAARTLTPRQSITGLP